MAGTIRVGLLFGNKLIRDGRRLLLQTQPDFDIVYEESNGIAAIDALSEMLVDVVLVDNRLSGISGSERFNVSSAATTRQTPSCLPLFSPAHLALLSYHSRPCAAVPRI